MIIPLAFSSTSTSAVIRNDVFFMLGLAPSGILVIPSP